MNRRWKVLIAAWALFMVAWGGWAALGWFFSPPVQTVNELSDWPRFEREVVGKDFRIPSEAKITLAESKIKGFDYGYTVEFTLPPKHTPRQWLATIDRCTVPRFDGELKIDCEAGSAEYRPDLGIYRIRSRPQ